MKQFDVVKIEEIDTFEAPRFDGHSVVVFFFN